MMAPVSDCLLHVHADVAKILCCRTICFGCKFNKYFVVELYVLAVSLINTLL